MITALRDTALHVTKATPAQWMACRDIRLQALQEDPSSYPTHYTTEATFSEQQWRKRASSFMCQTFLLHTDTDQLVGMAELVLKHQDVGLMCNNFITASFRGQGGGVLLEEARVHYAQEQGLPTLNAWPRQANQKICDRLESYGFVLEKHLLRQCEGRQPERLACYQGNTQDIATRLAVLQQSRQVNSIIPPVLLTHQ